MGFAAARLEGFPYRGSRSGGFATETLSRRKGNAGGRCPGVGPRGRGLAAPPVPGCLVAPLRYLFGIINKVAWNIRNYRYVGDVSVRLVVIVLVVCFHLAAMVVDKMKKMDWDSLVRNLDEDGAQPIRTWRAMKEAMTSRFVPTNYMRNIFDKLTLLRQGVKTVDEYYMEMEMLMQRGRVRESLEMTMQRFLNGLKYDIKGIVRHYTYTNMNQLLHHAREAESQLAEEAKVKGRATGAGRFTPRALCAAPSTRSVPYSTPPSKPVSNVSNTKKSESAASTSGSSMSTTRNRDMLCHTCGGKGHFKRDCPNRKVMFINEDNEYETGDDVDPNAPDDDDYDTMVKMHILLMLVPLLCRNVLLMCCLVHLLSAAICSKPKL
ncbi:hypothetical protein QYE76_043026 [Lolium multiflorum]|uniref:CCHC-type domain-containing protein n=1 Tax=Lolium multiflorum TaxID=4521 RepID=A0AAD8TI99_LOLMU|nr:hypothetical protein QYE76_043026 [Lolium multiflorum]